MRRKLRRVAGVLGGVVLTGVLVVAPSGAAYAETAYDSIATRTNSPETVDNSCIDLDIATGTIQQWPCTATGPNQQWSFRLWQQDPLHHLYEVVNKASGKCMAISGGGTTAGTPAGQVTCGQGLPQELWVVEGLPGTYRLHPWSAPQLCLDVRSGGTDNGLPLQQWYCNGTNAQIFWATYDITVTYVPTPSVIGLLETNARNAITDAGLVVGNVSRVVSLTASAGTVINQNPTGGTSKQAGTTMDITVSLGGVSVPNLLGYSESLATSVITSAGLTVGTVSYNNDCNSPGDVEVQSPSAGAVVVPGSAVSIGISTCTSSGGGGGIVK